MSCNRLELSGEVIFLEALRHTPAGIPILSFSVHHVSIKNEAGMKRQVECDVPVMAMGDLAKKASGINIGDNVKVAGFLAKKSLKNDRLVLHLEELETEKNL